MKKRQNLAVIDIGEDMQMATATKRKGNHIVKVITIAKTGSIVAKDMDKRIPRMLPMSTRRNGSLRQDGAIDRVLPGLIAMITMKIPPDPSMPTLSHTLQVLALALEDGSKPTETKSRVNPGRHSDEAP